MTALLASPHGASTPVADVTTPPAEPAPKRQMNVRIPETLIEQIDARRAIRKLSRDEIVARMLTFALQHQPDPRRRTRPKP